MESYVKLSRKLTAWKYRTSLPAFSIWVELILCASHTTYKSGTWTLERGQYKGSNRQIAIKTGVNRKAVNKWIKIFEEEEMIRTFTLPNNQGTIYTILKYDEYQNKGTGAKKGTNLAPHGAAHNNVTIGENFSDKKSRPKTREIDW